ncbi:MAG: GNAT family N-acetyltransferase [Kistimonas sp.]|nr:GNAT family N-acetyltransferase [Kistimonas sp.]
MNYGTPFPVGNPYRGSIEMSIDPVSGDDPGKERQGIVAHIYTDNLHMRSVQVTGDVEHYSQLFGRPENMKNYGSGQPWGSDKVEQRVKGWSDRWRDGNPFSGFAIFQRDVSEVVQDSEAFIGHATLGLGESRAYDDNTDAGYAEITYVIDQKFWGKGYGKQATAAVVNGAAPEYKKQGFKVVTGFQDAPPKPLPLEWLTATASPENMGSIKILTGLGFECKDIAERVFLETKLERAYFARTVPMST